MTADLESLLNGWTGPSSSSEQEKQERTERMVREAISSHEPFEDCNLSVFAKGSYPNNTNVRTDSDVDVAVQCHNVIHWEEEEPSVAPASIPYSGPWTPAKLRVEVGAALRAKFGSQVDDSGNTALRVNSSSARVDADVVPCFDYHYYFKAGGYREGCRIYRKNGVGFENYPAQHLQNGIAKNSRTGRSYKGAVRILKRVENAMLSEGIHREVQSFFVESLVYNCPDDILNRSTWVDTISGVLARIWNGLQGDEPSEPSERWLEVNECQYLFHPAQKWARTDGRDFAKAAWNYLELGS
jgi:hypothetical protein